VPVYVSMLRGINLGGKNRISMPDLRAVYERHGHDHVTTYVQSGNVVSRTSARSASAVERAITSAIAAELGLDITVLVRTPAHLTKVLDANPFVRAGIDPKVLHVTFLAAAPEHRAVSDLDGAAFAPDEFRVHGTEVYVKCPNGYGRTKINNTWFERKLAVAATTRNWKTVTQLAELANLS
jgi:uncharacterized protein (DUF1697 family)